MFGYVRVYKPELKIREYEEYKGVYCTLCKSLRKEYGHLMSLALSYDATFYVLLLSMMQKEETPCFQKGRCPYNLSKKCQYQQNADVLYQKAAALTVILTYYKVKDDMADDTFSKKSKARFVYPYFHHKWKIAKERYPEFEKIAKEAMQKQAEIEKIKTDSTDLAAEPSSKALSLLFSLGVPSGDQKLVLERLAYCVGRYVYLIDAYDDMKKDIKTKSYNPFIEKYNLQTEADCTLKSVQTDILETLHRTANEIVLSFNLLDGKNFHSILENILYDGIENQIATVQKSYEKGKQNHDESL